ncbi:DNA-binding ferritin-like protein (oxidative damage protectant) [Rubidibacter lacunae KORDI 51-2]|uniref:DNA-binding ferritin-like protein (Oxidative damage protectant) n=1 Tax=Rubidibacter lacunae KORDI 51-2 TaxID=582515 RepID=U5DNT2_9CHRO|nr:DNA starvation/stationary phase protection protein Dps [Rubidibacter lacunae]ERN42264.1 DNA-binding ferritin-like protein (oxidative damage protectant) [Rubidibacter lacunae KORDI 51-2]
MATQTRPTRLYATRIDLAADQRLAIVEILNATLATTLDLKTQVKQAHWNVKGKDFYPLHELFDEIAGQFEDYVDMVAERVTALGGLAYGTARVAADASILPEYPYDITSGEDHVVALSDRMAAYAKHVRESIDATDELGDADTADLYTEVSRTTDKYLWFLEAHLHGTDAAARNGAIAATV